jgi:hypothetical protein
LLVSQPEDYCSSIEPVFTRREDLLLSFAAKHCLLSSYLAEDCWYPSQSDYCPSIEPLSSRGEKTCFLSSAAAVTAFFILRFAGRLLVSQPEDYRSSTSSSSRVEKTCF